MWCQRCLPYISTCEFSFCFLSKVLILKAISLHCFLLYLLLISRPLSPGLVRTFNHYNVYGTWQFTCFPNTPLWFQCCNVTLTPTCLWFWYLWLWCQVICPRSFSLCSIKKYIFFKVLSCIINLKILRIVLTLRNITIICFNLKHYHKLYMTFH